MSSKRFAKRNSRRVVKSWLKKTELACINALGRAEHIEAARTRSVAVQPGEQAWDRAVVKACRCCGVPCLRGIAAALAVTLSTQQCHAERAAERRAARSSCTATRSMARALALVLAAVVGVAAAARPRTTRALAVRGGS